MSQIDRFTTPARRTSVSGRALPSPVSRLDAAALIAQIAEQTGIRLELLGHPPGGQIGAAYVRTEEGRDGVLTCIGDRSPDVARRLLAQVRDIGRSLPGPMRGDDLVHLDFHPGNVLVDDTGDITGVIDWAIRHFEEADITRWLKVSEDGLR